MAITRNTTFALVRPPVEGDETCASVYSADFSGAEDLIAAVSAKCLYIRKIQVFAAADANNTFTFGAGQGTEVTAITIGPVSMYDAGGEWVIDFGPDHAMKIPVGVAFAVDSSAATPAAILVWYKVAS